MGNACRCCVAIVSKRHASINIREFSATAWLPEQYQSLLFCTGLQSRKLEVFLANEIKSRQFQLLSKMRIEVSHLSFLVTSVLSDHKKLPSIVAPA